MPLGIAIAEQNNCPRLSGSGLKQALYRQQFLKGYGYHSMQPKIKSYSKHFVLRIRDAIIELYLGLMNPDFVGFVLGLTVGLAIYLFFFGFFGKFSG